MIAGCDSAPLSNPSGGKFPGLDLPDNDMIFIFTVHNAKSMNRAPE